MRDECCVEGEGVPVVLSCPGRGNLLKCKARVVCRAGVVSGDAKRICR